ncbi:leucine-rich repeat domain-containing protein [Clostridium tyrobutyricum]|uniref:leucine-rich repeat domain-containing protein n=1 Tax=Clostridium tyrobutyricum TaxID=1519 RepID=UPI001C38FB2D|nr:leucine-rich repeat domain-containing protein [Clostridium tyrobutyricum]
MNKPTGTLYKNDIDKISEINFYYNKIKNISGVENLTALQKLGLGGNQITDISSIKNLTNLKYISFSGNQIWNVKYRKVSYRHE